MANKRPKPEEIVTKLRQVEVLTGQGMPRLDAIRQIGVTEQTYYRWKKKYGGMGTDQLKELKRLQKENERLRKAVSDLTLDKLILKEAARGKLLSPARRRACIDLIRSEMKVVSEADAIAALLEFSTLWTRLFPAEQARIIQLLVRRVTVTGAGLEVDIRREGIAGVVREMVAPRGMEAAE